MPSPEDKVTIRDIERETGIPIKVITQWVDCKYLKAQGITRVGPIGKKRKGCGRVTKGRPVRWFFWKDVKVLLDRYRPGLNDNNAIENVRPRGFLHIAEAASLLRMGDGSIRQAARDGKLTSVKVPMNGVSTKRFFVFVSKAEVERIKDEADRRATLNRPSYGLFQPAPDTANPLISANDEVCLEARRKLWEQNGRIIPRKYLICVAGRRSAG